MAHPRAVATKAGKSLSWNSDCFLFYTNYCADVTAYSTIVMTIRTQSLEQTNPSHILIPTRYLLGQITYSEPTK